MFGKTMDWVQGPWSVQLYTVNKSSYSQLHLENRTFPYWIISYVLKGNVTTGAGGEAHVVRAGDVMLHPPHLPFTEYSERTGTHLWMQVNIYCSHHFDLLQLYRVSPVVTIPDPARFEAVFHKLHSMWEKPELPFRDLKLTSLILQLMDLILTGWEKAGSPERSHSYDSGGDRYARLISQMSVRLQDKLTREDLAALVRLNANYLDRVFRLQFGLTPMQMLRDMRLKRAKQLLERTEQTLEAIADQCGLSDASYFCKVFKKQFGVLPGVYRETFRSTQTEDLYATKPFN